MKTLLGILTLLLCLLTFSQKKNIPIINDSIKKAGIYKTFDEFKNNNPSMKLEYKILSESKGSYMFNDDEDVVINLYSLNIPKAQGRELGSIFGFSDGKSFYISDTMTDDEFNVELAFDSVFFKLENLDTYCIFETIEKHYYSGNNMPAISSARIVVNIMDIETGEVKTLNPKRLKKILAENPILLEKFNREDEKRANIKNYLLEYLKSKK